MIWNKLLQFAGLRWQSSTVSVLSLKWTSVEFSSILPWKLSVWMTWIVHAERQTIDLNVTDRSRLDSSEYIRSEPRAREDHEPAVQLDRLCKKSNENLFLVFVHGYTHSLSPCQPYFSPVKRMKKLKEKLQTAHCTWIQLELVMLCPFNLLICTIVFLRS